MPWTQAGIDARTWRPWLLVFLLPLKFDEPVFNACNQMNQRLCSSGWNKRGLLSLSVLVLKQLYVLGGKQGKAGIGRKEQGGTKRGNKEQTVKRKEMIYSKSSAGRGLLLLRVSLSLPLSLCSIYNSMGNCWVGSSEGFCCNWFKMQVVSLVVRKRRKGYLVSHIGGIRIRVRWECVPS